MNYIIKKHEFWNAIIIFMAGLFLIGFFIFCEGKDRGENYQQEKDTGIMQNYEQEICLLKTELENTKLALSGIRMKKMAGGK
ncbi:MAG TPA: hypothetical protein VGB37_03160 [Candidatus Lokiarchaeia archaeon]